MRQRSPTVISAAHIAEGDDLPNRADPIYGAARRTYFRKNIELRRPQLHLVDALDAMRRA